MGGAMDIQMKVFGMQRQEEAIRKDTSKQETPQEQLFVGHQGEIYWPEGADPANTCRDEGIWQV